MKIGRYLRFSFLIITDILYILIYIIIEDSHINLSSKEWTDPLDKITNVPKVQQRFFERNLVWRMRRTGFFRPTQRSNHLKQILD